LATLLRLLLAFPEIILEIKNFLKQLVEQRNSRKIFLKYEINHLLTVSDPKGQLICTEKFETFERELPQI